MFRSLLAATATALALIAAPAFAHTDVSISIGGPGWGVAVGPPWYGAYPPPVVVRPPVVVVPPPVVRPPYWGPPGHWRPHRPHWRGEHWKHRDRWDDDDDYRPRRRRD